MQDRPLSRPLKIGMVAGEASGDLLASLMIEGLRARWPELLIGGIGGPRMQASGMDLWAHSERLSVFGYVDALARLPELLRLRARVRDRLLRERPDVFVGIDAPDFNFGLERALRAGGIRTVHFVCPSIWAWRAERVQRLKEAADHVLCLFPFEPELLHRHGIAATFVGHPLADAIPLEPDARAARTALGLDAADQASSAVVALLPGSRRSEVTHLAPVMQQAALEMLRQRPDLQFVLPMAPGVESLIRSGMTQLQASGRLHLLQGRAHEALAACDAAVVASGTATLETALFKRPMVITYRMAWLNWQRMKGMRYQPWVGLPNVLAGEMLVPELLQDAATPQAIARETLAWLDEPQRLARYQARCREIHLSLRQNTGARAGDALAQVLNG